MRSSPNPRRGARQTAFAADGELALLNLRRSRLVLTMEPIGSSGSSEGENRGGATDHDSAERMTGAPRRRGAIGIATVAAIALAIAGGAALVAVRNGQTETSPTAPASASFDYETGHWGWWRVGEPAPGLVARIVSGYLGECVASGLPAACTSKDGVSWTLPPDPAAFLVDGTAPFGGWSVAHGTASWVATGTIDPGTWRSSDGLHWSAVTIDLPGLQRAQVQALADGFAMVAQTYDGQQSAPRLLTSTDGATWTPLDLPADVLSPRPGGAIGLVAVRSDLVDGSPVYHVVSSSDGLRWKALTLPDGVAGLSSSTRLQNGTYVGVGTADWTNGAKTLLTSADGLAWHAGTGPGSGLDSLAVVGQRVLAIARIPSTDLTALSESTDTTTWQRIAVLDGNPLAGTQVISLGDRVGLFSGSKLTMVGAPSAGGHAASSSPPVSSSSAAESPTVSPSNPGLVVGGWRWHELNRKPDGAVVRIANGYLGRCGDSMCTSTNGWWWQSPPDPAVFSADATALFTPVEIAHRAGGGYVIMGGEGLWYSTDGVRWQPSTMPNEPHGFSGLAAGSAGYALIGQPDDAAGNRCHLYFSTDGASWTDGGLVSGHPDFGGAPDTSGGLLASLPKENKYLYSADGRAWAAASIPAGVIAGGQPWRLADGSLILHGSEGLLHSTDGLDWTKLATGWEPGSLAVSGDRIVTVAIGSGSMEVAWESSDDGGAFHKLMDRANAVEQFGDLVLLRTSGGGYYVGAPLSPSESPGTTPSATGLPESSAAPTYTPPPTPVNGISREEAIRIATNAVHAPADQVASAGAGAELDSMYGRWVWHVSFTQYYGGPLNAQGTFVVVDFFTGEVLASGNWIS